MPEFNLKKTKLRLPNGVTLTSEWATDSIIKFASSEGRKVISQGARDIIKSYERAVVKDTGRLSRGPKDEGRLDVRDWGDAYYRESVITYVPYAGVAEKSDKYWRRKLSPKRSAARSTRTKMNKQFRERVVKPILSRFS